MRTFQSEAVIQYRVISNSRRNKTRAAIFANDFTEIWFGFFFLIFQNHDQWHDSPNNQKKNKTENWMSFKSNLTF